MHSPPSDKGYFFIYTFIIFKLFTLWHIYFPPFKWDRTHCIFHLFIWYYIPGTYDFPHTPFDTSHTLFSRRLFRIIFLGWTQSLEEVIRSPSSDTQVGPLIDLWPTHQIIYCILEPRFHPPRLFPYVHDFLRRRIGLPLTHEISSDTCATMDKYEF